jgi:NADPH-dependent 2,4-dienoyl-CoA reductase/sulfur reductase-like enzyme
MDKRRYVIIGGGPAGLLCAETLRQSNFTGEILIISADELVPYDRTLLSKGLPNVDASKLKLRDEDYLRNADIDIRLGVRAESVDTHAKSIKLSDGSSVVIPL